MAFLTDTLARAAFKRMLGKSHTTGSKDLSNEAESSFITITTSDIFADAISSTPAVAIAAGISSTLVSLTLTLDPSSNGKAYFASIGTVAGSPLQNKINHRTGSTYVNSDRVGFLIPPQYGTGFRAVLKSSGTEVAPSSSEDWFIDYVAGIVTSEDNLNLTSGTLEAYVYTGRYLNSLIITYDLSTLQSDGYGVFTKGPGGVDGYSIVPNNVGIGTTTPIEKLTINTSTTGGLALNNSSTNDPVIRLQLVNTDTFIMGIDNSDSDRFKLERGSVLGTNNDLVINSSDGYVGIGTNTPQQKLQINGNIRFSPNNSNIIGDLDLAVGSETSVLVVSDTNSTVGTPLGNIVFGAGSASAAVNATYAAMFPSGLPRAEYMRVRGSDGYVGVGTTAPITNGKLTVFGGNISVKSGNFQIADDNAFIGMDTQNNLFWNNTNGYGVLNFKSSASINIDSDNDSSDTQGLYFGKNQAGATQANNLMTIHESGRVGIGTTNPDFKLTVHGNLSGDGTFKSNGIEVRATNTSSDGEAAISWASDGPAWGGAAYWIAGLNQSNPGLDFAYGTAFSTTNTRVHMGNDGYVGIGTATGSARLNVYDGYDSATQANFTQSVATSGILITSDFVNNNYIPGLFWSTQNNNGTKPKAGIYPLLTSSGSYLYFGTSNSYGTGITNNAMVIKHDGTIGIGNTNPSYNLHIGTATVTNAAQTKLALTDTTNSNRSAFVALAKDSGAVSVEGIYEASGLEQRIILGSVSNHEVQLRTSNLVRQTILETGEVGIGTTSPSAKLEIDNAGATSTDILSILRNGSEIMYLDSSATYSAPPSLPGDHLVATDATGRMEWAGMFKLASFEDDFIGDNIGLWGSSNTNGTITLDTTQCDEQHFGVVNLTVTTTSTASYAAIFGQQDAINLAADTTIFDALVKVSPISQANPDYDVRVGLGNVIDDSTPTEGIWFEYRRVGGSNSGWVARFSDNGTAYVNTDTATSVSNSVWYRLSIVMRVFFSGTFHTTIDWYINDTLKHSYSNSLLYPDALQTNLFAHIESNGSGGASASLYLDYMSYKAIPQSRDR